MCPAPATPQDIWLQGWTAGEAVVGSFWSNESDKVVVTRLVDNVLLIRNEKGSHEREPGEDDVVN